MSFEGLEKDVTFFANNEVSRQAIDYLAETLQTSGFEVRITDDRFREAEIGIYPSPGRTPYVDAELSIAMFHGIDAGYAERYWPYHDWSQFDLGLLPGQAAAETWQRTSDVPHARPEMGMYVTGWPKADFVFTEEEFDEQVEEYREEYGIWEGKTIVYAPLAESRGKSTSSSGTPVTRRTICSSNTGRSTEAKRFQMDKHWKTSTNSIVTTRTSTFSTKAIRYIIASNLPTFWCRI
jgi:hypothetical protein